jgi:hypothetical protein
VLDAMRDAVAKEAIVRVLGRADASDLELAEVSRRIDESGARDRAETRIRGLVQLARAALDRARLTPTGHALLVQGAIVLTERGH